MSGLPLSCLLEHSFAHSQHFDHQAPPLPRVHWKQSLDGCLLYWNRHPNARKLDAQWPAGKEEKEEWRGGRSRPTDSIFKRDLLCVHHCSKGEFWIYVFIISSTFTVCLKSPSDLRTVSSSMSFIFIFYNFIYSHKCI